METHFYVFSLNYQYFERFLVSCYATLDPALSVRRSVGLHESKSVKTHISAPAHLSATGMAVYPTLFFSRVHATLQPALSVGRLVGWSVGRSRFTFFGFFAVFGLTAPAQLIK